MAFAMESGGGMAKACGHCLYKAQNKLMGRLFEGAGTSPLPRIESTLKVHLRPRVRGCRIRSREFIWIPFGLVSVLLLGQVYPVVGCLVLCFVVPISVWSVGTHS